MSIFRNLLPSGLANLKKNHIKKVLKAFLPLGIINIINQKRQKKKYTLNFLRNNYVSDLTDQEKWSLLAYLLFLEKKNTEVKYLEVGIYAGGTTKFLIENTKKTNFTGIDLFEDFQPGSANTHFWQNYRMQDVSDAINSQRLRLFKGNSTDVLNQLEQNAEQFDLIFIDGNHTYKATKDDFNASLNMLNKGGFMVFHNCSPGLSYEDKMYLLKDGGPWMLTEELKESSDLIFEFEVDRIRVFRKK